MEPVQLRKQPVVECDVKELGVVRVNADVGEVSRNNFVDVVFITVDARSACCHDGSCKQGDSLGQESVVLYQPLMHAFKYIQRDQTMAIHR